MNSILKNLFKTKKQKEVEFKKQKLNQRLKSLKEVREPVNVSAKNDAVLH